MTALRKQAQELNPVQEQTEEQGKMIFNYFATDYKDTVISIRRQGLDGSAAFFCFYEKLWKETIHAKRLDIGIKTERGLTKLVYCDKLNIGLLQ